MTFIIGADQDDIFARLDDQLWPGSLVSPERRSFAPSAPTGHFSPAGERYRALDTAERDALVAELAIALSTCDDETKARMIRGFSAVDIDYGRRVFEAVYDGPAPSTAQ
jgi:catalase